MSMSVKVLMSIGVNVNVQGYLAHTKTPPLLGPPQVARHRATAGSYGGGVP